MTHENFKDKIAQLYEQFQEHDKLQADRLTRYRNIEPESAQFLATLLHIQRPQHVLEIGTSTGYSTLWLAHAVCATSAKITTLELDQQRLDIAKGHAQDFALDHKIDFQHKDAFNFLSAVDQDYDFVLLDAERDAYVSYWPHLKRLLIKPHAILVVDNVLSHANEVEPFKNLITADHRFQCQTLNIGAGLMLITQQ